MQFLLFQNVNALKDKDRPRNPPRRRETKKTAPSAARSAGWEIWYKGYYWDNLSNVKIGYFHILDNSILTFSIFLNLVHRLFLF